MTPPAADHGARDLVGSKPQGRDRRPPRRTWLERSTAGLVVVLCLFPFAYLGFLSIVGTWSFPDLWPAGFRFDRWGALLAGGSGLGQSLLLSVAVSGLVAVLATSFGFVAGRAVSYHRHRAPLLFLAYLPFALSPVILGACLLFFFIKLGLVATLAGVVLAHSILAFAWSVVFWSSFWNAETLAMEHLVALLGGTSIDLVRRVLLPLSREPLLICLFQTFLVSWFQYGLTVLVGAGKVQTLPLKVYDYLGEANVGFAAVAGLLLVVPPLLLLALNRHALRRLVEAGR